MAEGKLTCRNNPRFYGGYTFAAASAGLLGREAEAHEAVCGLLEWIPYFTLRGAARNPMFVRPEDGARMIEDLWLAGVPE